MEPLSIAALLGEPGGGGPSLRTVKNMKKLWKWASLSIGAPLGNLEGAH